MVLSLVTSGGSIDLELGKVGEYFSNCRSCQGELLDFARCLQLCKLVERVG